MAPVRKEQNFPPLDLYRLIYMFRQYLLFRDKTTWVNAECRDAPKNTLRTVRGLAHKKLVFFCMRFSVKSVSTGNIKERLMRLAQVIYYFHS
jgi:hypothetical protein